MKRFKIKLMALLTMCCMLMVLPITAFAEEATTPVSLDAEAATLNVTVPTALPIAVSSTGEITCADTAKVINNSYGPVKLTEIRITAVNGWQIVAFDTDMSKEAVGAKKIGLKLNGDSTQADGSFIAKPFNLFGLAGATDTVKPEHLIIYDAVLPAQAEAITGSTIANVVFVIDWDKVIE